MPTDPVAALLYVSLLLPGVAFVWSYEGHRPTVKRSAFRETASVVIASVASLGTVFVLTYLLSFLSPPVAAYLHSFVTKPDELIARDTQLFIGVVLGLLTVSTALGLAYGSASAFQALKRFRAWAYKRATRKELKVFERGLSAWSAAFEAEPEHYVNVGVQLKSGAWIQGGLDSYTQSADEGPDRAMTLNGTIECRLPGSDDLIELEGVGMIVVTASEIDFMTVSYEPKSAPDVEDS